MNTEWLDDLPTAYQRLANRKVELPADGRQHFTQLRRLLQDEPPPAPACLRRLDTSGAWLVLHDAFTIGRHRDNDLTLPLAAASNFHCRLDLNEPDWVLTDLDSTNGTKVNGVRIPRRVLCLGDIIAIGEVRLLFVQIEPKDTSMPG